MGDLGMKDGCLQQIQPLLSSDSYILFYEQPIILYKPFTRHCPHALKYCLYAFSDIQTTSEAKDSDWTDWHGEFPELSPCERRRLTGAVFAAECGFISAACTDCRSTDPRQASFQVFVEGKKIKTKYCQSSYQGPHDGKMFI